jgi:photosystem II stability/assembly factor-like uncharacterized protein
VRNYLLTLILLGFVLLPGCNKLSQPETQAPPPQVVEVSKPVAAEIFDTLSYIKMFDEINGWAISPAAIIRQVDGKWVDVTPNGGIGSKFGVAEFIDINNGWVSVSKEGAVNFTILRTDDGGKNWLATDLAPSESGTVPIFKTINFIDSKHGWLAVSYGMGAGSEWVEIYQSNDGGETWGLVASPRQNIPQGIPGGGLKTGVSFIDASRGWLTGVWYGDSVYLYVSNDSGRTWQLQTIQTPAGYPIGAGAVQTRPVMCFDHNSGILPLVFNNQGPAVIFCVSEDKGLNWRAAAPLKSTADQSFTWSFADIKDGVATDHLQLYATNDSGQTWQIVKPNIDFKNVVMIDFVSSQIGWAIGQDIFIKTVDGGLTWKPAAQ